MAKVNVKFKKLTDDAELPKYAHPGDLGMDVKAVSVEYNKEKDVYIYHTGLACETKKNVGLLEFVRSSNYKTDCYLTNHVGVIDSAEYRGEIQFRFKNRTSMAVRIEMSALREWAMLPWYKRIFTSYEEIYEKYYKKIPEYAIEYMPYDIGDKIGQFVVIEVPEVTVKQAKKLSETSRGEGGHGSTGK